MHDLIIASKFVQKANRAEQAGHSFDLTFNQFKKLMNIKKCYYTGITLVENGRNPPVKESRTIDRLDSTKGYVAGNVVACSRASNQLKSIWEGGDTYLTTALVKRMMEKL